jgi:tripartite-type tricarboxylate transporter receptor subunit TctC
MRTIDFVLAASAGIASLLAPGLAAPAALAQDWPTRPMTMVAPFAAGGSTDAIARIVADGLSSQLHQPVIVENVGGAGGMTGANRVAKATPDGYQFVLGNVGTHAQNQTLYKRPAYNAITDFAPVALITDQPLVLVTRKDFPPIICRSSLRTQRQTKRNCNTVRPGRADLIISPASFSIQR